MYKLCHVAWHGCVAGPVIQTTKTVKEVIIGPGITLGSLSLEDYRFITSLPVVEEQQH